MGEPSEDTEVDAEPEAGRPAAAAPSRGAERWRRVGLVLASLVIATSAALLAASYVADATRDEEPPQITLQPETDLGAGGDLLGANPVGDLAPDAPFERFDGSEGTLADYAGRPLVVNFFAEWCVPCREELPALAEADRRFGDEVAFLGLNVRASAESARAIAAEAGVDYDLANDVEDRLFVGLGGSVMPYTVFIGADGQVLDVHRGAITEDELVETITTELLPG
ncbi:MAG TPA: TlpA disulfide reductase family protein [Acidimicrobiales bacterium]